jgi:putative transposase
LKTETTETPISHSKPLISCLQGRCTGDRPVALPIPIAETEAETKAIPMPMQNNSNFAHSLGSFIAGFKAITTKRINQLRGTPGARVWQRNYYEHIIDNDEELQRVRQYIEDNPRNWNKNSVP